MGARGAKFRRGCVSPSLFFRFVHLSGRLGRGADFWVGNLRGEWAVRSSGCGRLCLLVLLLFLFFGFAIAIAIAIAIDADQ